MAENNNAADTPAKQSRKRVPAAPVVASASNAGITGDVTKGAEKGTKRVVAKAKEATSKLATEAVSAARNAANEGKDRTTEALNSVSKAVAGAADLVDEKIGGNYGNYARKAADQVSGFADTLQSKDIDSIIDDTREFVRKQPMIAIGAAAAIGFVLTRLVKIGGGSRDSDA